VIGRLEEWISQVATISGFGVGGAARGGAAAFICTSGEREIIASPFCVNATFPCTASSMVLLAETVFFQLMILFMKMAADIEASLQEWQDQNQAE
jgi:hypothetical protein